jgi:hypothetical protein
VHFLFFAVFLLSITASAAEREALAISAQIQQRHMPFGIIVDPIHTAPDSEEIQGYTRCGDSAIWTGHYLAAEAFRYKVTRDPDALANAWTALNGLRLLLNVTGTSVLARCAIPIESPYASGILSEEQHHGAYIGNFDQRGYFWVGNTSRDQYAGVFFGLAVAWDLIDDPGMHPTIADLVWRMVDFLQIHRWTVVMPDGRISTTFIGRDDQQLSLLQVAKHVIGSRFVSDYRFSALFHYFLVPLPIAYEVLDPYGSYHKFNLDTIYLYNLIRYESNSTFRAAYNKAYDILRNTTDDHQNAFFNMIEHSLRGPDERRDSETVALLEAWLRRPKRDFRVDLNGVVPVCGDDRACDPVPVELRPPTDFLWQRNPFQLAGGGDGFISNGGIDYILPYWMARFYGVISE